MVEAVLSVVISLLRVVVKSVVVIIGAVVAGVVALFLFLPQAASANESASAKNIARIFFIAFSLKFFYKGEFIEMQVYFVHSRTLFCIIFACNLWKQKMRFS